MTYKICKGLTFLKEYITFLFWFFVPPPKQYKHYQAHILTWYCHSNTKHKIDRAKVIFALFKKEIPISKMAKKVKNNYLQK